MQMKISRRHFGQFSLALGVTAGAGLGGAMRARAASLPQPKDKVILTISGMITNTNKDKSAVFDMAMIEALGVESFKTKTPWYKEPVTFSGPPMSRLIDQVGAKGTTVTVTALNDYATDIPLEDCKKYPMLLATKRNGVYMPVKDKGPLFIVYNYDSNVELQHQRFYSRSAWQVARMVVK